MMSILVDEVTEWVRWELKNGKPFESSFWTNLAVDLDGLKETVSARLGKDVEVAHYVHYCDDDFFKDPDCVYWWKKFPKTCFIVIDEVHFYLGKKVEHGSIDLEEQLINYLSMHRHEGQELYFLSQHTDNFANQILGMADTLWEIVNMKNMFIPFPVNVPMADLDTVKRAFGIKTQYYRVNIGNYRGKAVKWTGGSTQHFMRTDIFRSYQTHTGGEVTSDRPEVERTPFEAVLWFSRRHALHLVPKAAFILGLPFIVLYGMDVIPTILMEATKQKSTAEITVTESETGVAVVDKVKTPEIDCKSLIDSAVAQVKKDFNVIRGRSEVEKAELAEKLRQSEQLRTQDSEIVGIFSHGIIVKNGKIRRKGDTVFMNGKDEILDSIDVPRGSIKFASGKIVTF